MTASGPLGLSHPLPLVEEAWHCQSLMSHASAARIETIYLVTIRAQWSLLVFITSKLITPERCQCILASAAALFLCLHLHFALKLREARKHGQLTPGLIVKAGNCPVFYSKKSVDVSVQWISIELFLLRQALLAFSSTM